MEDKAEPPEKAGSPLIPLIIVVAFCFGAVLVIAMLLALAGFLTAPFILSALLIAVTLGLLVIGIRAATLSRRP
jgi:hypothetical protein